ncbi:hypothetical protein HIM_12456 [Hirsutella minnesotensis 3608]|uniref:Tc1-like transposase DDE domain-containing protein n=1 Tax=Hirsutella minnesotensis 3608 TaxID=1043627 RepID=A0A0F7ZW09_9HYPO|nr:hypothetical protein HIM_12456 [Hirsutella minnesotensis 3608]
MSRASSTLHPRLCTESSTAGKPPIPWKIAALVGAMNGRVSRATIRRALCREYRRKWRSMKRIPISKETAALRLQFAQGWEGEEEELAETIFSDECSVQNAPNNPNSWVFRKAYERFQRAVVNITTHGKPTISLMVWAGIWRGGRTKLVIMERDQAAKRKGYTARSYRKALSEGLLPVYDGTRRFQQDNAKIHVAGGTPEWLQLHGIEYIDWPPHSPDLNPIEHMWKALKDKLGAICPHLHEFRKNEASIAKLTEYLHLAWEALPQDLVDRLIDSVPRRLAAVRRARGWYTKY